MIFVIKNTIDDKHTKYFKKLIRFLQSIKIKYCISSSYEELLLNLEVYIPSGFILSGSPIMFTKKDYERYENYFTMNIYILENFSLKIPIFGICFGAQLISLWFGGKLKKIEFFCETKLNYHFCLHYILESKPFGFNSLVSLDNFGYIFLQKKNIFISFFHPEYHKKTWKFLINFLDLCNK